MQYFRKFYLWILSLLALLNLFLIPSAAYAKSVPVVGNITWELVQGFAQVMREQEANNRKYVLPVLIVILLLILFFVGRHYYRRYTGQINPDENKNKYTGWW